MVANNIQSSCHWDFGCFYASRHVRLFMRIGCGALRADIGSLSYRRVHVTASKKKLSVLDGSDYSFESPHRVVY